MGHGTDQHREQNPGTGYYKGHDPGTKHEKGHNCCDGHTHSHEHSVEQHKDHVTEKHKKTTGDDLIENNIVALTETVASLSTTLELLVQKTEKLAYHIIAAEEIIAEIVEVNGLNLSNVNARIRTKIGAGTDNQCDPNQAIDIAASIASTLRPRS